MALKSESRNGNLLFVRKICGIIARAKSMFRQGKIRQQRNVGVPHTGTSDNLIGNKITQLTALSMWCVGRGESNNLGLVCQRVKSSQILEGSCSFIMFLSKFKPNTSRTYLSYSNLFTNFNGSKRLNIYTLIQIKKANKISIGKKIPYLPP